VRAVRPTEACGETSTYEPSSWRADASVCHSFIWREAGRGVPSGVANERTVSDTDGIALGVWKIEFRVTLINKPEWNAKLGVIDG